MNLRAARSFYLFRGYKEIYVPTVVEAEVLNSTCPYKEDLKHDNDLYHVASAEQGFIQLLKNGEKLNGKYFTITSCQRPYDKNRGDLYQEWFLKLELFHSEKNQFFDLLSDARDLYSMYFDVAPRDIDIEHTKIGIDLLYNEIEIGSYGMRKVFFEYPICKPQPLGSEEEFQVENRYFEFAYGTGYVPFRLSIAKNL